MTEETKLLLCPFCGSEPSVSRRQDEDLATHNIVEWVCISCIECGSSHCEWPVTVEPGPIERWNTRTLSPPEPTEGQAERPTDGEWVTARAGIIGVEKHYEDIKASEGALGVVRIIDKCLRYADALRAMPLQQETK